MWTQIYNDLHIPRLFLICKFKIDLHNQLTAKKGGKLSKRFMHLKFHILEKMYRGFPLSQIACTLHTSFPKLCDMSIATLRQISFTFLPLDVLLQRELLQQQSKWTTFLKESFSWFSFCVCATFIIYLPMDLSTGNL